MLSARRMRDFSTFHVMEILARARELERQGRDIIHMEIGEPDFPTPPLVLDAAREALDCKDMKYTPAGGLPALRSAIVGHYRHRHGVRIDPGRVFVTPGASGALLLALALVAEAGDRVAMADPGYPCYPNFVRLFDAEPLLLPVDETTGFNLDANLIKTVPGRVAGAIVASPANPTGSILPPAILAGLVAEIENRGGFLVSDEIYHGLEYGARAHTALSFSDNVLVINSFSKYFGMTGWRLGWVIVPEHFTGMAERLAQNLFIAAPTPSQLAALASFTPENRQELERRRQVFAERRELLSKGLEELGFVLRAHPDGAFYLFADCRELTPDSRVFARDLLEQAGVAVTPGLDFGVNHPERHLRFCYTASAERLQEGLGRIRMFIGGGA